LSSFLQIGGDVKRSGLVSIHLFETLKHGNTEMLTSEKENGSYLNGEGEELGDGSKRG
jgi:hypothetical protein